MSLEASHYEHLDIVAVVEQHTSTRLRKSSPSGKQWVGACPFDDCSADDNGFMVWPELSKWNRHYHCRVCRRSGDIVRLIQDIKGWDFKRVCKELDIKYWVKSDGSTLHTPGKSRKHVPAKRAPVVGTEGQQKELAFLQWLYPALIRGLGAPRSRAYLVGRGVPFEFARQYGLAYVPPFAEIDVDKMGVVKVTIGNEDVTLTQEEKIRLLKRWQDRILFPLYSPDGQGFIGRALIFWKDGMSEQEHRQFIDDYNKPIEAYNKAIAEENKRLPKDKQKREKLALRPYLKTCPAGYFHSDEVLGDSSDCQHATFSEGPFDALAVLSEGILDVVATCGTSLEPSVIPVRICDATLAYDGDERGKKAAQDVYTVLRRAGITPRVITPPDDDRGKDWSERYRLHGREGLAPLFAALPHICLPCGAPSWIITEDNKAYCKTCWRRLGHEPQPGDGCVVCGDFIDYMDEEGVLYCADCWEKVGVQVVGASIMHTSIDVLRTKTEVIDTACLRHGIMMATRI